MLRPVIGVDFDNTLVTYDAVLYTLALERGLLPPGDACSGKKAIRDRIRLLPGGEIEWQRLQAVAYGPRIGDAVPSEGASAFLAACRRAGLPVYVVSHKTEFAAYDDTGTNLRKAALAWMAAHGLFDADGGGLSPEAVFFAATRYEKIEHVRHLGCTHFIDDLEETFHEPGFPAGAEKILYAPAEDASAMPGVKVVASWAEIREHFFPSTGSDGWRASGALLHA